MVLFLCWKVQGEHAAQLESTQLVAKPSHSLVFIPPLLGPQLVSLKLDLERGTNNDKALLSFLHTLPSRCPALKAINCYASRQTYVEVKDIYPEGGTHEETLHPQSKARVMNKR